MLNKSAAELALKKAVSTGGDFAEFFYEDTRRSSIAQNDDKIETAVTARNHGVGLRVYRDLNSVYVHSNDPSPEGLMKLACDAADAIGSTAGGCRDVHLVESVAPNIHVIKQMPMDVPGAKRAALVRNACRVMKDFSPEIAHTVASLLDWEQHVTICNTEGMFVNDIRVYSRAAVQAIASNGSENQVGFFGPGAMSGFELFEEQVDMEAAAKKAAQQAVTMLHGDLCPAGVMPVIIDGGFGGVIFHEACGHSLEATSVAFGNSEFCGKMGQQIGSKKLTAIDDGTIPNNWGSENIDDEGNPTTKLVLIENGILKNYMVDKLNARRMQLPVTGSARRQGYMYAPTSRMRNTYIAAGEDDNNEIITTMGDGLYAKAMGGGSVEPSTGKFNFAVSEGYLVKDGKIVHPVRGASLIGRGSEILPKIDRVGRDMQMAQGMCGSLSGSVPTNVGQPMIRVTSLTVGGR